MKLSIKHFLIWTFALYLIGVCFVSYWVFSTNKANITNDVVHQLNSISLRSPTILQRVTNGTPDKLAIQEFLDSNKLANCAIESISISLDGTKIDFSTDRKKIDTPFMKDAIKQELEKHSELLEPDHLLQEISYTLNDEKLNAFIVYNIKNEYIPNKILAQSVDTLYIIIMTSGSLFALFLFLLWQLLIKPMKEISTSILNSSIKECENDCEHYLYEIYSLRSAIVNTITNLQTQSDEVNKLNTQLEKRVSDELQKSRQKDYLLIQQSKLATMGEMINAIAHQWRQPLNTLGLTIQDIKYAFGKNEIDENYITTTIKDAMTQIKYMSKTIDDFRNFYKPTKEKKLFSLNKSIIDSLSLVRARLEAHYFEITEHYDDDIPEINGYENEFKQAILNIITNTQDIADEKKLQSPTISIKTGKSFGYALVEIEDNCGGIPATIIERIFEPYFTTKEQGKGTGIGLYMTKTIIEENMGGHIEVNNTMVGAKFTINLPII